MTEVEGENGGAPRDEVALGEMSILGMMETVKGKTTSETETDREINPRERRPEANEEN
jgi:hypothetical protein